MKNIKAETVVKVGVALMVIAIFAMAIGAALFSQ